MHLNRPRPIVIRSPCRGFSRYKHNTSKLQFRVSTGIMSKLAKLVIRNLPPRPIRKIRRRGCLCWKLAYKRLVFEACLVCFGQIKQALRLLYYTLLIRGFKLMPETVIFGLQCFTNCNFCSLLYATLYKKRGKSPLIAVGCSCLSLFRKQYLFDVHCLLAGW